MEAYAKEAARAREAHSFCCRRSCSARGRPVYDGSSDGGNGSARSNGVSAGTHAAATIGSSRGKQHLFYALHYFLLQHIYSRALYAIRLRWISMETLSTRKDQFQLPLLPHRSTTIHQLVRRCHPTLPLARYHSWVTQVLVSSSAKPTATQC